MPVIRISDQVFSRLQKLAEPFVDTPGIVIERLLDYYEKNRNENGPVAPIDLPSPPPGKPPSPNPDRPPDLRYAKILSAQFNGRNAQKWNELITVSLQVAFEKLGGFEAVKSATLANIVRGSKSDQGFHYIPHLGVSIQGASANQAWSYVLHLAQHLNVSVSVEFEWRHKAPAAYRGKRRSLDWSPRS